VVPRTHSNRTGALAIRQESFIESSRYTQIPSTFLADTVLDVLVCPTGMELRERALVQPFHKDYDAICDPTQWPHQFDVSHWAVFGAYRGDRRVGAAVTAFDTPGVEMLEGRTDLVVLWDLRVSPDARRSGVGAALFDAVELWGALRNCRELKIETQNTNVAACRFYASRGCRLRQANRGVYPPGPTVARPPMTLVVWLILLVLCWPLALLALVLWPIVWLLSLPFRLIGITFEAVFALLRAVLFLPARVLGGNPRT